MNSKPGLLRISTSNALVTWGRFADFAKYDPLYRCSFYILVNSNAVRANALRLSEIVSRYILVSLPCRVKDLFLQGS